MRHRQHASPAGKINVTPLIDVVMVLIVFYLIVGQLAHDRAARVDLPESGVGQPEEGTAVVITVAAVDAGGGELASQVYVDGQAVAPEALTGALQAARSPSGVAPQVKVRADRRLSYGAVSPVLEACRGAGIASVKLVAERPGVGP